MFYKDVINVSESRCSIYMFLKNKPAMWLLLVRN